MILDMPADSATHTAVCPCGCTDMRVITETAAPNSDVVFYAMMCPACALLGPASMVSPEDAAQLFAAAEIETCLPCAGDGCDDCNGAGRVCV
jgi:hypothetical protein